MKKLPDILTSRRLLLLPALALAACAPPSGAGGAPPATEALTGTYELTSIEGRPLPVREFQAVYHAGRITLHPDRRYVSAFDVESCTAESVCTRETLTREGEWLVLPDGTLSIRSAGETDEPSEEEEHTPPPRIEADGREIRYYTPSVAIPIFRYTRR